MNCKKNLFFNILLLLSLPIVSISQDIEKVKKQDFPISMSYNNHSWAFPLGSILRLNPQYPGLTVGTEINYRVRPKTKLFQVVELGGFLNSASGNATYVNTSLAFRLSTDFGLYSDIGLGLGIFSSYYINDTYTQQENGSYSLSDEKATTALSNNIFLGLGYDLSKKYDKNLQVFVRYQWIASGSYWSMITIRPSGLFHIGIRHSLRTNKK